MIDTWKLFSQMLNECHYFTIRKGSDSNDIEIMVNGRSFFHYGQLDEDSLLRIYVELKAGMMSSALPE